MRRRLSPGRIALLATLAVAATATVAVVGDRAAGHVHKHGSLHGWVVLEETTHGLLGAAVCLPLFWGRRRWPLLLMPFLLATAIDLDHAAVATERVMALRSDEQPVDAIGFMALGERTPIHSLTFAALMGVGVLVLTLHADWAWVVAAALASHVIRDAHFGALAILWPQDRLVALTRCQYVGLEVGLTVLSCGVLLIYRPANRALRLAVGGLLWRMHRRGGVPDHHRGEAKVP